MDKISRTYHIVILLLMFGFIRSWVEPSTLSADSSTMNSTDVGSDPFKTANTNIGRMGNAYRQKSFPETGGSEGKLVVAESNGAEEEAAKPSRNPAAWISFILIAGFSLAGSYLSSGGRSDGYLTGWRSSLTYLMSLWLPLAVSLMLLYFIVSFGPIDELALILGEPTSGNLSDPNWADLFLYILGLAELFHLGQLIEQVRFVSQDPPSFPEIKSLALLATAVFSAYALLAVPAILPFMLPVLIWLFISGGERSRRVIDILLFAAGILGALGLLIYFKFDLEVGGLTLLWKGFVAVSIHQINFLTAVAAAGVLSAGLSMVVRSTSNVETRGESDVGPA